MNKKVLLILICISVIAGSFYYILWQPLPAVSEIESIQTSYRREGKQINFELPSQYWKSLWSTLLPARNDWSSSKWVVFGGLDIKLKNGANFSIVLYRLSEGAGAFSTPSMFGGQSYYRGGNSDKMIEVINQAYQDTIQVKP